MAGVVLRSDRAWPRIVSSNSFVRRVWHDPAACAYRPRDAKAPTGWLPWCADAGTDPFSGARDVFRAKRADRVKIVWWTARDCASSPSG